MTAEQRPADPVEAAVDEANERALAWLSTKARNLSASARRRRRRREAHVIVSVDERGRLSVRFRPEESPETEEPDATSP